MTIQKCRRAHDPSARTQTVNFKASGGASGGIWVARVAMGGWRGSWKENVPKPLSFTVKSGATDHFVQARREQVSRSPHPAHNFEMAPSRRNPKTQSVQL